MSSTAISSTPASPKAAFSPQIGPRKRAYLLAALLSLATLFLYWPATSHDFVNYDDNVYVFANPHVISGLNWENFKWAWVHPVSANWHPLTLMSHMADCQWYGLKPWGHHLTSVVLHALNAALVLLLLRSLTGALWRSLWVGALFALHPLRVESVAWVAERKDVLSGCFGLLALLFYTRYARNEIRVRARLDYALAWGCLALGLLSKPMLVTWPCVMLLLDYWPLGRWEAGGVWRLVREKLPFFALAAVAGAVTFVVQRQNGAVETSEILPWGARGGNALISYCRYLGKLFWPVDLAYFYPHPGYWPGGQVALAGLGLAGITGLLWAWRRWQPWLLMGWLWYVGTLVPVIGMVQAGLQAMADRYMYLPSVGVLIAVVWGGHELARRRHYLVTGTSVAGTMAIIMCWALTRQQLGYWQDSESLFRHAAAVTMDNYIAYNNLGITLYQKGRTEEAMGQFQEAIRVKPEFAETHNNLALALDQKGQTDGAIGQYLEALHLKPNYAEAHCNLGIALYQKGRTEEAMSQFQEALHLKPDFADAHFNLALALDQKGQTDGAIRQFQEALRLNPEDAEAHYSFALVLDQKGRTNEAIDEYQAAIRLKPDNAGARNNLGLLWAGRGGSLDPAREMIQKAVELEPRNAAFLDSLAWVYLKENRLREALDCQRKALENSSPPDAALYDHLGNIYAAQQQKDLAAGAWHQALSLGPDSSIQKKLAALSAP